MKKGISLIVLVITIIVMIIIAGAIIISLNSTNVMTSAEKAVTDSDLANAKYAVSLAYADVMTTNHDIDDTNDYTVGDEGTAAVYYRTKLAAAGYNVVGTTGYTQADRGFKITVAADSVVPVVEAVAGSKAQ